VLEPLPFLAAFLGWLFQGTAGFGAGVFIVSICSPFYDARVVIVSSAPVNLAGNLAVLRLSGFKLSPFLRYLLLGSFFGLTLGTLVLSVSSRAFAELAVGLFVLSLALREQRGAAFSPDRGGALLSGFLGGFFAGLVGTGGPPPALFLKRVEPRPEVYRASLAVYFLFNLSVRLLFYGLWGSWRWFDAGFALSGSLGAVLGALAASRLPLYRSERAVRRLVSTGVLASGLYLLVRGASALLF